MLMSLTTFLCLVQPLYHSDIHSIIGDITICDTYLHPVQWAWTTLFSHNHNWKLTYIFYQPPSVKKNSKTLELKLTFKSELVVTYSVKRMTFNEFKSFTLGLGKLSLPHSLKHYHKLNGAVIFSFHPFLSLIFYILSVGLYNPLQTRHCWKTKLAQWFPPV